MTNREQPHENNTCSTIVNRFKSITDFKPDTYESKNTVHHVTKVNNFRTHYNWYNLCFESNKFHYNTEL